MPANRDWSPMIRRMELLLRLKSFPVAFKLLEKKEDLAGIPFLRRMNHKSTLCQLISLVRSFDWTVGADLDDFLYVHVPLDHRPDGGARADAGRNLPIARLDQNPGRREKIRKLGSPPPRGKIPGRRPGAPRLQPVRSGHRAVLRQPRPDDAPDQRPAVRGLRGHAVFLRGRVFLLRRHRPLLSRRKAIPLHPLLRGEALRPCPG